MRRGLTLAELMVVISVISMTALLLIPAAGDDQRTALRAAAELLAADIEDTQARMLADPLSPTSLFVNEDGDGWHLARNANPSEPILGRDGLPRTRRFGDGALANAKGLTLSPPSLPGGGLSFDDQGAPIQNEGELEFILHAQEGDSNLGVLISASTGSVKIIFE
jgi:prepilin-type N-terminal cleavage/methylation domain-containing protein